METFASTRDAASQLVWLISYFTPFRLISCVLIGAGAEFTAFGARVTAITLAMSSVYLALWLYVGSTPVNHAGLALLV